MQARVELPNECCGLLAGKVREQGDQPMGEVLECYPLVNALASPFEYESEPRGMFTAVRDIDRQGLEILAVYHSHPTSSPLPSRKDCERSFSPEVVNLIISLQNEEAAMKAWWLMDNSFREADWVITD